MRAAATALTVPSPPPATTVAARSAIAPRTASLISVPEWARVIRTSRPPAWKALVTRSLSWSAEPAPDPGFRMRAKCPGGAEEGMGERASGKREAGSQFPLSAIRSPLPGVRLLPADRSAGRLRPSRVEIVPVEDGVEAQEEGALGLPAPERTDGEHHHVPLADRGIHQLGPTRQRLPAHQCAGEQHVVGIGREREHHPGTGTRGGLAAELAAATTGTAGRRGRRRRAGWHRLL